MNDRPLRIIRWCFYLSVALLVGLLQLLLSHLLPDTQPFLLPLLVAIAAAYEQESASLCFALLMGLCADLLTVPPVPCCYTLSFVPATLLCIYLAQRVIAPGFLCSLLTSLTLFIVADSWIFCYLLLAKHASFLALCKTALLELLLSLPFLLLLHPLCLWIHKRCLAD